MQLTPDQINEFVANAIMQSQIGDAVKASIQRVMEELMKVYRNPFDDVIRRHVTFAIEQTVLTEHMPQILETVRTRLATHITDDVVEKFVAAGLQRLTRDPI